MPMMDINMKVVKLKELKITMIKKVMKKNIKKIIKINCNVAFTH